MLSFSGRRWVVPTHTPGAPNSWPKRKDECPRRGVPSVPSLVLCFCRIVPQGAVWGESSRLFPPRRWRRCRRSRTDAHRALTTLATQPRNGSHTARPSTLRHHSIAFYLLLRGRPVFPPLLPSLHSDGPEGCLDGETEGRHVQSGSRITHRGVVTAADILTSITLPSGDSWH